MQVFRSLYNHYYTKPQILYMLVIPCKHVTKTIKGQLREFRKSPCDYNEHPFCAINLLMKWTKFVILHTDLGKSFTQQSQLHIKMSSNHNDAFVSIWTIAIQYTQPLFYAFLH